VLPKVFHSEGGCAEFIDWLNGDALKSVGKSKIKYERKELIVLGIGLAIRNIVAVIDVHSDYDMNSDAVIDRRILESNLGEEELMILQRICEDICDKKL
jgi:hypothetical protein